MARFQQYTPVMKTKTMPARDARGRFLARPKSNQLVPVSAPDPVHYTTADLERNIAAAVAADRAARRTLRSTIVHAVVYAVPFAVLVLGRMAL